MAVGYRSDGPPRAAAPIDTGRIVAQAERAAGAPGRAGRVPAPRGYFNGNGRVGYFASLARKARPGPAQGYLQRSRRPRRSLIPGLVVALLNGVSRGAVPDLIDSQTGARIRMGVRYPMRGGGDFEVVRFSGDYPARVLIRVVKAIGFGEQLWQSRAPTWAPLGLSRAAIDLGSEAAEYRWLPVHRIDTGRAFVAFPTIDLGRVVGGGA